MTTLDAPQIDHRPECTGGNITREVGRKGDTLERCHGCGRFVVVVANVTTPATDDAPARTVLRYRCREHGHPVCWRGRGCKRCTAAREAARAGRRRKPKPVRYDDAGEPLWLT